MSLEHTQLQSNEEQEQAKLRSLQAMRAEQTVSGYELRKLLGVGAFGEVWVAFDQTTGRQVAIKFYAHRGGLDWSLLSREVEKLAFLSADRYVVQLLDVGWDADPPYYVMEYVEHGSLEDLLKREGRLPAHEAVTLFREIAIGLLHAHAKGVLHCDLKPANVLLDQDTKPRIADFGQSRLSNDQTPALGTLFYMAPEQADLKGVPDVRWDVYALGALLYAMLTGEPPYRTAESLAQMDTATDLDERLKRYRELIAASPRATAHRQIRGVDRALAEIVDGCIAPNRKQRFANVQSVLDALDARNRRRARWPLLLLGAIGPAIVVSIMSLLTWRAFETVVQKSDAAMRERVLESNEFAAQFAAKTVANELDRRYRAIQTLADSAPLQGALLNLLDDPELTVLREKLNDPKTAGEEREQLLTQFRATAARAELQTRLDAASQDTAYPVAKSWFITDDRGLQLARSPETGTVGQNYGWRTYFQGANEDRDSSWRPGPQDHITRTHLSRVYRSESSNRWNVAITTPIIDAEKRFLGVLGMSVEVGRFVQMEPGANEYSVLVDWRPGPHQGLILQHPLFNEVLRKEGRLPDRFRDYRLKADELPEGVVEENYVDPLAKDPEGNAFDRRWLAKMAPVETRDGNTGWILVVQRDYGSAIGGTLSELRRSLSTNGLVAVGVVVIVSSIIWILVARALGEPKGRLRTAVPDKEGEVTSG